MKIYSYDKDSKLFTGAGFAQKNPKKRGEYLFPQNSTTIEPPILGDKETAVFKNDTWQIIPDFRGLEKVEIETGEVSVVTEVGELKKGYMLFSDFVKTDLYKARVLEDEKNRRKYDLMNKLYELDKKRIRAVCENEIKNSETGETWLDFYNAQIVCLRNQLKEMEYDA